MDFRLTDQQQDFASVLRRLGQERLARNGFAPRAGSQTRDYLKLLANQGLAGIFVPEADGGQGGTLVDAVLAIETLATFSAPAADAVQALNFGAIQQLARHGTAEQKQRLLAPCLRGEKLVTIAMSEPEAGSAVTDLRTSATRTDDGVTINGQKLFSTHGDTADLFVVWVRFGPRARDAGAVILERGREGFTVDGSHRFMAGEPYGMLYFDDCGAPGADVLLWEEGFSKMLGVFNIERLGNASRSLGYGQAALQAAMDHARDRRQFGRRLVDFQGLQWRFAEMSLKLEAARLLLYRAAANADTGNPSALETSWAKLACNRAGFEVADAALQILGGYGYDDDSDLSYMFKRTRGWLIAGGTVEQMLNRIAAELFGERFPQRPDTST
jgi:hypothetical protein